jgi:hypothetical protein
MSAWPKAVIPNYFNGVTTPSCMSRDMRRDPPRLVAAFLIFVKDQSRGFDIIALSPSPWVFLPWNIPT